ncbi:hypothetical protein M3Y94_00342600 [Aphelenchoides besseyi]|nr:hypothetical protein M3Y94_00342600 [Aphelenchoides besseyi]KAI6235427.1 hypothetical protein M3Y95_00050600 [Aphelenchoides besseyi]
MSESYGQQMSGVGQQPLHPRNGHGFSSMARGGPSSQFMGPGYGMAPRQVLMQGAPMQSMMAQQSASPQQFHHAHSQQTTRTPPTNQGQSAQMIRHDQLSSMSQMYRSQQTPPVHNQQILMQSQQNVRNQQRIPPSPQQMQIMQQQNTPPKPQTYGQSPFTPQHNQQPSTPQTQPPTPQYQQPSTQSPGYQQQQQTHMQFQQTQQVRYVASNPSVEAHRQFAQTTQAQQQQIQRSMTPQNVQSPAQRKTTVGSYAQNVNVSENMSMTNNVSDGQYMVQTTTSMSNFNSNVPVSHHTSLMQQTNPGDKPQTINYNNTVVVNQSMQQNNFNVRHPVSQRPIRFTNQMGPMAGGHSNVRYSYPMANNSQQQSVVMQSMPNRMPIRPNTNTEYRQPMIQVIRSESEMNSASPQATYRTPISTNNQTFAVTSQSNVFYRPPLTHEQQPQPHTAIRQALGHPGSQQQIIMQGMDTPANRSNFKMPIQQQGSMEVPDYQNTIPTKNEITSEFIVEQQSSQVNVKSVEPTEDHMMSEPFSQNEPSAAKKAKTANSGKGARGFHGGVNKPTKSNKSKKPANKSAAMKSGLDHQFEENSKPLSLNPHPIPVITEDVLEMAAHSISNTLIFEEDVKAGIMIYMENFVDQVIRETGRAAGLRKSKQVKSKDVEYALRNKLKLLTSSSKR